MHRKARPLLVTCSSQNECLLWWRGPISQSEATRCIIWASYIAVFHHAVVVGCTPSVVHPVQCRLYDDTALCTMNALSTISTMIVDRVFPISSALKEKESKCSPSHDNQYPILETCGRSVGRTKQNNIKFAAQQTQRRTNCFVFQVREPASLREEHSLTMPSGTKGVHRQQYYTDTRALQ